MYCRCCIYSQTTVSRIVTNSYVSSHGLNCLCAGLFHAFSSQSLLFNGAKLAYSFLENVSFIVLFAETSLILLPFSMFELLHFFLLILFHLDLIFDTFFVLQLLRTFDLRLDKDVLSIEEPDLTIVILEEITVDLEYFNFMDLLQVVAHFEDHSETVVLGSEDFELVFDLARKFDVLELFCGDAWLTIFMEVVSVLCSNQVEVIVESQCLDVSIFD